MPAGSVDDASAAFRAVVSALFAASGPEWVGLELSMAQLKALFALRDAGPLSLSALAEKLGGKLPAASVLADRLVNARLVTRHEDADDRRRVRLALTPEGEDLVQRLRGGGDRLRAWMAVLPLETRAQLTEGLTALAEVARRAAGGDLLAAARR